MIGQEPEWCFKKKQQQQQQKTTRNHNKIKITFSEIDKNNMHSQSKIYIFSHV
jgi:hypothetical protein